MLSLLLIQNCQPGCWRELLLLGFFLSVLLVMIVGFVLKAIVFVGHEEDEEQAEEVDG